MDNIPPVAVVVELVVAGVSQVDAEPGSDRVEDLDGGVNPDRLFVQLAEVRHQVEVDAFHGPREHQASAQQDGQQHVRHGGRDPHHLP